MDNGVLEFVGRYSVTKEAGHVLWYDLFKDKETGAEYFLVNNGGLTLRHK